MLLMGPADCVLCINSHQTTHYTVFFAACSTAGYLHQYGQQIGIVIKQVMYKFFKLEYRDSKIKMACSTVIRI